MRNNLQRFKEFAIDWSRRNIPDTNEREEFVEEISGIKNIDYSEYCEEKEDFEKTDELIVSCLYSLFCEYRGK